MRTVYGDHQRFIDTYFSTYPGMYFTGDGARRDEDGYWWITGRVDDVLNVSGHRIGTAEVESALVAHPKVAEAAVVAMPHEIKGQGIYAYVTLNAGEQGGGGVEQRNAVFPRQGEAGWAAAQDEPTAPDEVKRFVKYGASPRAAIALAGTARASALVAGKPNVGFEDVRLVAPSVLGHRLILDYAARLEGWTPRRMVDRLIEGPEPKDAPPAE